MRMGVGGLLKDTDARPLPRARAPPQSADGEPRERSDRGHRPGAGKSTRMAPHNKLLVADRAGKPMIARVVDNVLSSRPADGGGDRPSRASRAPRRPRRPARDLRGCAEHDAGLCRPA